MPKLRSGRRKATLRDVALKAGVSVATVSRVLNTPDLVAEPTRTKVGAAIEELQFAPSAAARSLNAGKTRTIGVLVQTIDHTIFALYLQSLEATLSQYGYGLIVAVTGGDLTVEADKARDLLSLGVDGLIVTGVTHAPAFDAVVARFGVPVMATSYYADDSSYPTIGYDNAAVARMAITFLRARGHGRISVVHGPVGESDRVIARIAGARVAGEGATLALYPTELSVTGGVRALDALLARHAADGLTDHGAVLCLSDVQALGVLFEAQRRGLRIPEDLSIMGFDDLEWSCESDPALTTIRLPSAEMGVVAGSAMMGHLLEGKPIVPQELRAQIVERASVSDRRDARDVLDRTAG